MDSNCLIYPYQSTLLESNSIKISSGLFAPKQSTDLPYFIGVDEVGRGSFISRVYVSAVVLPDYDKAKDLLHFSEIRDSKKIHSKPKMREIAKKIKEHAIAWSIAYEDEKTIDEINILQATQSAMHKCITDIYNKLLLMGGQNVRMHLCIDGNYFKPFVLHDTGEHVQHTLIKGGDNIYCNIAAASILAKVARDDYLAYELCVEHPELSLYYKIDQNMGYGSKRHIDGIRAYGISEWHRKTFGICSVYSDKEHCPVLDMEMRETLCIQDLPKPVKEKPIKEKKEKPIKIKKEKPIKPIKEKKEKPIKPIKEKKEKVSKPIKEKKEKVMKEKNDSNFL